MSDESLRAAVERLQQRANTPRVTLMESIPDLSKMSIKDRRLFFLKSTAFIVVSLLGIEYYATRAPKTAPMEEKKLKWSEFRRKSRESSRGDGVVANQSS